MRPERMSYELRSPGEGCALAQTQSEAMIETRAALEQASVENEILQAEKQVAVRAWKTCATSEGTCTASVRTATRVDTIVTEPLQTPTVAMMASGQQPSPGANSPTKLLPLHSATCVLMPVVRARLFAQHRNDSQSRHKEYCRKSSLDVWRHKIATNGFSSNQSAHAYARLTSAAMGRSLLRTAWCNIVARALTVGYRADSPRFAAAGTEVRAQTSAATAMH